MSEQDVIEASLRHMQQMAGSDFKAKTKKFKYKELMAASVISSSEIPMSQQRNVVFEFERTGAETFNMKGMIKGLPGFSREIPFALGPLFELKQLGSLTFDTDKGLTLNVIPTLLFLNKNFFGGKK